MVAIEGNTTSAWKRRISHPGTFGLALRMLAVAMVQILVSLGLLLAISQGVYQASLIGFLVTFAVVMFCQLAGQWISERPEGDDWIMVRLFGSLAVRTALPLAVLFVIDLVSSGFLERNLVTLMILYFVGLVLSSTQMVFKLQQESIQVPKKSA